MKQRFLLIGMVVGVTVGALGGWLAGPRATSVAWVGDLFLNALKTLVLPLVFCSMVEAVSGLVGRGRLGGVALKTFAYYLATTVVAVVLGLVVVSVLRPGDGVEIVAKAAVPQVNAGGVAGIAGSIVTPNIFKAAVEFRVLPILLFGLVLGAALGAAGQTARTAVEFFRGLNVAMLKLVDWLMWTAPFGVAALIAAQLGESGGGEAFAREVAAIGMYCFTVIAGLAIHGAIVLPLILRFLGGRSPLAYARDMAEALLTAFSTASSSATLAVTMRLCQQRGGVSKETSDFVLPLGATVNMDGTALYEAVAAMFIAQAWGLELGLGGQVVIVLTATLASVGAAGIPQAGLVTMVLVLEAVGLPLEGIAAILSVDWFLDRCRTTVNVWGDAVAAAVVDAHSGGR
ncbi:MAG: dicarboxylate/amino acid:cation symporter [Deltaproteobacteria bacterium]